MGSANSVDWQNRVPANGPLRRLLNARFYSDGEVDLLCFVRDAPFHINDTNRAGKKIYVDEAVEECYSDSQYVEKIVGDAFPLHLVDLYNQLNAA